MELIKCNKCGREVSDKAQSCPNCGTPITSNNNTVSDLPKVAKYNPSTDTFSGTMNLLV